MNIKLKKLSLLYFKGAEKQEVDFTSITDICGANASGKTRLFDAFTWVLFGKDSEDKKDFNIKKLDSNNEPLHRVDHSVIAILAVDGIDTRLERVYKEKWIKKRGEETHEFAGHETEFTVNRVPVNAKEYQQKVESILSESLFKQLTNPLYFNSMKWTDRRAMLTEIAGNVKDSDVVAANPEFIKFFDLLIGRSPELFRKEIAAQKKLLKESIANIPARIDEVSRAIVADPDYGMIEKEISDYCKRISEIDIQLNSEAENYNAANKANQERQNKIFEKQRAIDQLKNEDLRKADQSINHLKLKKNELDSEISWYDRNFTTLNNSLDSVKRKITQLNEENANLRSQWEKINESVIKFNEDEFSCPTCKRAFESDDIEAKKVEMLASFNKNKMSRLDQITNTGKSNKAEIERLSQEAVRIQDQIDNEKTHANEKIKERDAIIIPSHAPAIESNPQIAVLQSEIEAIKAEIKPIGKTDDTVLKTEKDDLRVKIDFNKTLLNIKAENAKHKTRKTELINQEKSLAQQIADLEKQEFQADAFEKAKIDMVEEKVNSMFTTVKFKMFNTLINGGTEPCCETLINGVPYADANNAAKIQGGLDIIRTLSRHYDVYAPVFIDNRESVTDIPDMECQIINLIVDPSQKTLQVKNYSDIPEQLTFKN